MLGVVVPYWNPFGNRDRLAHLDRCLTEIRTATGVRVLCVEMVCEGRSGLADIVLKSARDSPYIWQKECLINYGCSILAGDGIGYLGYVDADCLFLDSDWPRRIIGQFESGFNMVQGFSHVPMGGDAVPAALTSFPELGTGFHGGSMFLRRDLFLRIGGFYEYCIVGGGDSLPLMAATGDLRGMKRVFTSEPFRAHAARWLDQAQTAEIHPACAGNAIQILDHGNPRRSRRLRHALLKDFSPDEDVIRGDVLSFTERGKRLLPRLRAYTAHREDRADIVMGRD